MAGGTIRYRPRATRMKRPAGPTFDAKQSLTEDHGTGSPRKTSTAAWISCARIGASTSVRICVTASKIGARSRSAYAVATVRILR
jgi:hypothetical protein